MIERRSCTIDAAAWRRDLSYLKRSIRDCQSSAALQRIDRMLDELEGRQRAWIPAKDLDIRRPN
jgi:hypothetical protein